MKFQSRNCLFIALGSLALSALPAFAQGEIPGTCSVPPKGIQSLAIERTIQLNNVLTTLDACRSSRNYRKGDQRELEERSRIIYDPDANTLYEALFLVPPDTPRPTPDEIDVTPTIVQDLTLNIDVIYTSCRPRPTVMIVGRLVDQATGPLAAAAGAPAVLSLAYTLGENP